MGIKVGINGFGRIGRLIFRALIDHADLEVAGINDLMDSATMAHLLKYDSVHGTLNLEVIGKDGSIEVGGKSIAVSSVKDPATPGWKTWAWTLLQNEPAFSETMKAHQNIFPPGHEKS